MVSASALLRRVSELPFSVYLVHPSYNLMVFEDDVLVGHLDTMPLSDDERRTIGYCKESAVWSDHVADTNGAVRDGRLTMALTQF